MLPQLRYVNSPPVKLFLPVDDVKLKNTRKRKKFLGFTPPMVLA
jgi:hypothetical protein